MTRYDDYKPREDKRPDPFATIGDLFKNLKPAVPPVQSDDEPKER